MAMEAAEFSFLWEPTINSDVLRLILSRLPLSLIARTACVCRSWYIVATDPELLMGCFKVEWKLADVVGKPSGKQFFDRGLHRFAISHPLQRWDTVDSLAVKYDVEVSDHLSVCVSLCSVLCFCIPGETCSIIAHFLRVLKVKLRNLEALKVCFGFISQNLLQLTKK